MLRRLPATQQHMQRVMFAITNPSRMVGNTWVSARSCHTCIALQSELIKSRQRRRSTLGRLYARALVCECRCVRRSCDGLGCSRLASSHQREEKRNRPHRVSISPSAPTTGDTASAANGEGRPSLDLSRKPKCSQQPAASVRQTTCTRHKRTVDCL